MNVDARRIGRAVVALPAALAALVIVLFVAGINKNGQITMCANMGSRSKSPLPGASLT